MERKSDLDFFDNSAAHSCTLPRLPFFQDFLEGNYFFPFCQDRVQTKHGILDQAHVPVAFLFHGDLPKILCQREKLTANRHCLYPRPSGHRSKDNWLELSTQFCFLEQATHRGTQYPCKSGQAYIVCTHQSNECSLACSCLDWSGESSILALIVLLCALARVSLLACTGCGWMRMHA